MSKETLPTLTEEQALSLLEIDWDTIPVFEPIEGLPPLE